MYQPPLLLQARGLSRPPPPLFIPPTQRTPLHLTCCWMLKGKLQAVLVLVLTAREESQSRQSSRYESFMKCAMSCFYCRWWRDQWRGRRSSSPSPWWSRTRERRVLQGALLQTRALSGKVHRGKNRFHQIQVCIFLNWANFLKVHSSKGMIDSLIVSVKCLQISNDIHARTPVLEVMLPLLSLCCIRTTI